MVAERGGFSGLTKRAGGPDASGAAAAASPPSSVICSLWDSACDFSYSH